jgi:transcriptional regulator with XRE-family HTH domain
MTFRATDDREDKAYRLSEGRRRARLTVQEVASKAGLDRTTISTYESRRKRPSPEALARWEAALIALAREQEINAKVVLNDLGAGRAG